MIDDDELADLETIFYIGRDERYGEHYADRLAATKREHAVNGDRRSELHHLTSKGNLAQMVAAGSIRLGRPMLAERIKAWRPDLFFRRADMCRSNPYRQRTCEVPASHPTVGGLVDLARARRANRNSLGRLLSGHPFRFWRLSTTYLHLRFFVTFAPLATEHLRVCNRSSVAECNRGFSQIALFLALIQALISATVSEPVLSAK